MRDVVPAARGGGNHIADHGAPTPDNLERPENGGDGGNVVHRCEDRSLDAPSTVRLVSAV